MHYFQLVSLSGTVLDVCVTAFWTAGWSRCHWHQGRLCIQASIWELQTVFGCSTSSCHRLTWIRWPLLPLGWSGLWTCWWTLYGMDVGLAWNPYAGVSLFPRGREGVELKSGHGCCIGIQWGGGGWSNCPDIGWQISTGTVPALGWFIQSDCLLEDDKPWLQLVWYWAFSRALGWILLWTVGRSFL